MIKIYGEKQKGKQPSESAEMITFFSEFRKRYPHMAKMAIHIRNEGKRTVNQTARHKAEGMVKGASDIIIIGAQAFCCEMKSKSATAKVSKEQIEWLEQADDNGAFACIAYGFEAALEAVEEWLYAQG